MSQKTSQFPNKKEIDDCEILNTPESSPEIFWFIILLTTFLILLTLVWRDSLGDL